MRAPIGTSFDRHSLFTDLTKRSAKAFKLGDRGGNRMTSTPSRPRNVRNAAEYFVSRSTIKCCLPRSIPDSLSVRVVLLHLGNLELKRRAGAPRTDRPPTANASFQG